jgi:glycerol uptake facilitator-like aquaporin
MAVSEFCGTFFIVFVSSWSILLWQKNQISLVGLALANGFATAVCVWAGFDASEAHFNPIVSLVRLVTGKFPLSRTLAYVFIQLFAATLSALFAALIAPREFQQDFAGAVGRPVKDPIYSDFQVFLFEFIGSMLYIYVFYSMVVDRRAPSNVFGIALGSVITICTIAFGKASGACINPVRIFGAQVILNFDFDGANYWLALISGGFFMAIYYNAFILKSSGTSYEVEEANQHPNMVSAENINQAMNLKY